MIAAFRKNWLCYLGEALGVVIFMFFAGVWSVLVNHPNSSFGTLVREPLGKNILIGLLSFPIVAWGIGAAPWGKRTGSHINPSVTLAFWRLGKIAWPDALFYILFQFVGAFAGVGLAWLVFKDAYAHPAVDFTATVPREGGWYVSFGIEFLLSFFLMATILFTASEERLRKRSHLAIAVLISSYLFFAQSYSGMSTNPARSTASNVVAGEIAGLWIYLAAPVLAMQIVVGLFRRHLPHRLEGPTYPVDPE